MNINIHDYDYYLVQFSGGKDSTACFLWLLDQGVPKEKIELWHQDVDGYPIGTNSRTFMDWECTVGYCDAFAKAFKVPLYISYRAGGFRQEMLRENSKTGSVHWEQEFEWKHYKGDRSKENTRLQFPQVSADLSCRWCSAYLKIDVYTIALRNQERFQNKRTLVLSGERAQESDARALYNVFEVDKADNRTSERLKRHVDRLRPVHSWMEEQVWAIIERYKIQVHPCYYLGFNRCSCKFCIFGNQDQFASAAFLSPYIAQEIASYEKQFGKTIKRKEDIMTLISRGVPYAGIKANPELAAQSLQHEYKQPIFISNWVLPSGAYNEGGGPQ